MTVLEIYSEVVGGKGGGLEITVNKLGQSSARLDKKLEIRMNKQKHGQFYMALIRYTSHLKSYETLKHIFKLV